jgi:hypothetical protein
MNRDVVILFLALLAVATQVAVVGGSFAYANRSFREPFLESVGPLALRAAAAVAGVSMLGSLYLSEVAHFLPCKLCWYQRIAMYSLAVILVIAAVRNDGAVRRYAIVLASIGAAVAIYHVLVERFPQLESSTCDPANPCSLKWVEKFGYVTIPVMALTGFIAIIGLLSIDGAAERRHLVPRSGA